MPSIFRSSRLSRVALVCASIAIPRVAPATSLDDYVAAPDPSYAFDLVSTSRGGGYTLHVLELTSQSWRSSAEVDRTLWRHWLSIVVPDAVTGTSAFLYVTGGANGSSAPTSAPSSVRDLALGARSVAAELKMVPNQPLVFAGDGRARVEDEILSYTFDKCMVTGDGTWPALLPMVKSAVRAMDAIQAYLPAATAGTVAAETFVVSGASKRGWTTWLTAAVDPRVKAIVPMVIDVLDLDVQMAHHRAVYEGVTEHIIGGYSDAVHDYVDLGVMDRLQTPEGQALAAIVDPYDYRARLTMPKLLIHSTGDQFFVPDSARFYFHDLPGPKYLRYLPNTDHSLDGNAALSARVFFEAVIRGLHLPEFAWTVEPGGTLRVTTVDVPAKVALWQARNPAHRDFRLETLGAVWTSSALADEGGGVYTARVSPPSAGFAAFFVALEFASGLDLLHVFTTEVVVIPAAGSQLPGDSNQDGELDISDAVSLLLRLFDDTGGRFPCGDGSLSDPGNQILFDSNGDGGVDISDPVQVLAYLFAAGSPPFPGAACLPIPGCPDVCRD